MNFILFNVLALIGVVICDVLFCKYYKLNNKFVNYFLVFVMIFGHPIYCALTALILLWFGLIAEYHITYLGVIVAIFCMLIFSFLRYKIVKKFNQTLSVFEFSKFYFFTLFFMPCILFLDGAFNVIFLLQVLLPILGGFSIVYSLIKLIAR